jgi:hypothetical protein
MHLFCLQDLFERGLNFFAHLHEHFLFTHVAFPLQKHLLCKILDLFATVFLIHEQHLVLRHPLEVFLIIQAFFLLIVTFFKVLHFVFVVWQYFPTQDLKRTQHCFCLVKRSTLFHWHLTLAVSFETFPVQRQSFFNVLHFFPLHCFL